MKNHNSKVLQEILDDIKKNPLPQPTEREIEELTEKNRVYGTAESKSLETLREAGFKPIAITRMMFEETFVFETEDEAVRAHEEFEHNPKHGTIVQGWWYGREYFTQTILQYHKEFCDNKVEDSPPIFWLNENIITHDSREIYLERVVKRLHEKHSDGHHIVFTFSEQQVRNHKEYFFKCWKDRLSPHKALTFFADHLEDIGEEIEHNS